LHHGLLNYIYNHRYRRVEKYKPTHCQCLHKSMLTQVNAYTSQCLHKSMLTQVNVYTSQCLHKSMLTQVNAYINQCLHKSMLTQVNAYTSQCLHKSMLTHSTIVRICWIICLSDVVVKQLINEMFQTSSKHNDNCTDLYFLFLLA